MAVQAHDTVSSAPVFRGGALMRVRSTCLSGTSTGYCSAASTRERRSTCWPRRCGWSRSGCPRLRRRYSHPQVRHLSSGRRNVLVGPGRGRRLAVMTPDERWLAALWPSVRAPLPNPPARVLEIGCGPLGGSVPMLRADGYAATGIDPEAPEGADFRRVGFEDTCRRGQPTPSSLAPRCTTWLTWAACWTWPWRPWCRRGSWSWWMGPRTLRRGDRGVVLRRVARTWRRAGLAERSLRAVAGFGSVLGRLLWSSADGEGLHSGEDILRALQARFETRELGYGAYFFPDLSGTEGGSSPPRSTPGRSGLTGSSTTAAGERRHRPADMRRSRSSSGKTLSGRRRACVTCVF